MPYYVIDEDNHCLSWSEEDEIGETFASESDAVIRAQELARAEPGKTFYIALAVRRAKCPVAEPEITVA